MVIYCPEIDTMLIGILMVVVLVILVDFFIMRKERRRARVRAMYSARTAPQYIAPTRKSK